MLREFVDWARSRIARHRAGDLEEAREAFRAGRITEWKFRGTLARLGYTRYGIDREVEDQLLLMAAP